MQERSITNTELELLNRAVARLRAGILAIVFAMTCGVGLFLATAWLLARGGKTVGPHLALLSNYFPGYTVTWPGCFVGLFYGSLVGGVLGWSIAWLYNRFATLRARTESGSGADG